MSCETVLAVCKLLERRNKDSESTKMTKFITLAYILIPLGAATLLGGCATSVPKAQYSKELPTQYHLNGDDKVQVRVDSASGVAVTDAEKQQLTSLITAKVEERRAKNPANGEVRDCNVVVTVTRFDKGNAFARFMLAGLGQIHLDASVQVFGLPANDKLNDFTVSKTFAWGGIYGASTTMETLEPVFADSISAALTGQEEAKATNASSK